jgi:hypothetical protein
MKILRTLILAIVVIVPPISQAQSMQLTNDVFYKSGPYNLMFVLSDKEAKELAKHDIDNGTPFLLLQSGLAPTVYTTDSLFEAKFQVNYYDHGCIGPTSELIEAYNQVIFEFLDRNYEKAWRRSVRKDVVGYKNWKRNN